MRTVYLKRLTIWTAASLAASALIVIVSLALPATPLWPFITLNWLIWIPGYMVLFREVMRSPDRDVLAVRSLALRFVTTLVAFAVAGQIALANSNSMNKANDGFPRTQSIFAN